MADLASGEGGVITITGVFSSPLASGSFTNTAAIATLADVVAANNIAGVGVDGVSQGAQNVYTFTHVTADHALSATFAIGDVLIIASTIHQTCRVLPHTRRH